MKAETLDEYINDFKEQYPALFKDEETQKAFTAALVQTGKDLANDMTIIVTDKILRGVSEFALFDLKDIVNNGLSDRELEFLEKDPAAYVKALLTGTWNVAMDLVEMVGVGGIDVKTFLEQKNLMTKEDIIFTSKEVGKA